MGHRMHVGYKKIATFGQYLASSRVVNSATVKCCKHMPPDRGELVTLIPGSSKPGRLLIAEDGRRSATRQWILFMTGSLDVTLKTLSTEQNLIVRIGESEAEVANNKRLRSMYCTVESNYWQTRSIARLLCNSRASYFTCIGMCECSPPFTGFCRARHRAMPCKRGLCHHAVSVRLSVCPPVCMSVTFVHSVKSNKDIFEIFHDRVATPF